MVLITAQLGVARPDCGQRKVRNITPGTHFHLGKLGWRHVLPMGATPPAPTQRYVPYVKPGPIQAGLSKRWWTQELVLKNGVYFQSGKEPLRIGVPYETVLMEGNYQSANHMTRPSRPTTEFRMLCGGTETPDSCQLRGKIINFP